MFRFASAVAAVLLLTLVSAVAQQPRGAGGKTISLLDHRGRSSDGRREDLEHVGVTPDETVLPTASDLAANRDPALARAIAILGGSMSAEQAGRLFR